MKLIKLIKLIKSPKPEKKWRVIFKNDNSHVDFGQKGYSDYTIHKDPKRMKRYLVRHGRMHENWKDIKTAGFWSRWLLWSKPNIVDARRLIEHKFHVKIR